MKAPKPAQAQEAPDRRSPEAIAAEKASSQAYLDYLKRQEALRANPAAAEADFMREFSNISQPSFDFMRQQAKGDEANISADLGWGMKRVGPQAARLSRRYGEIARGQGEDIAQQRYNYYTQLRGAGIPGAPMVPGYTPQAYRPMGQQQPSPFSQIFGPLMGAAGRIGGATSGFGLFA